MEPAEEPEKPAEPNRTLRIDVRVSPDEKKQLQEKAKAAGYKNISNFLREVGQGVEIKESLPPELRRQLVGIGTNLNQIARRIQSNKSFTTDNAQLVQIVSLIRGYLL